MKVKFENGEILNNGDGLYFLNENNEADGLQINVVLNNFIIPNTFKTIKAGTEIYRNSDAEFIFFCGVHFMA